MRKHDRHDQDARSENEHVPGVGEIEAAHAETLTLLRKPLGIEKHMGGLLIMPGDPLDLCMVGWLVGPFDAAACIAVVQTQRPEPAQPELDASE